MSDALPRIDSRSAVELERQLVSLLQTYAPEWREYGADGANALGASAGLTGVFARFGELIIQRINQAPEKNRLAFLDMLGATPSPPLAARTPLTFTLAAKATGATAPAGSQVSTPPDAANPSGLVFETVETLTLTPARLAAAASWNPHDDAVLDLSSAADPTASAIQRVFGDDGEVHHALLISQDSKFGFQEVRGLTVGVQLAADLPQPCDPRRIVWEAWDGVAWTTLTPSSPTGGDPDTTAGLTRSGVVTFEHVQAIPSRMFGGQSGRWLRARLITPIEDGDAPRAGRVRRTHLPRISAISIGGLGSGGPPALPEGGFQDASPLDVSRDFKPFAANGKPGCTWYLACGTVLERFGAQIGLSLSLSDTAVAPRSLAYGDLQLQWEVWTEDGWTSLGTSMAISAPGSPSATASPAGGSQLTDGSFGLTRDGVVTFVLPKPARRTTIGGLTSTWLRVRIIAGGYFPNEIGTVQIPSVKSCTLFLSDANAPDMAPDAVAVMDGLRTRLTSLPCDAFPAAEDKARSLYLGFAPGDGQIDLGVLPISIFADLVSPSFATPPDDAAASAPPRLAWSYWSGEAWSDLYVADGSAALTRAGVLSFLPPSDLAARSLLNREGLFWLRASWTDGGYQRLPRLRRLLLNTVMAQQGVTIRDEILGSSTGQASQTFTAAQTPILKGVSLHVIEPELPPAAEREALSRRVGPSSIAAAAGGVRVLWTETTDFYASGPRDRHFLLDHASGTVTFGDGVNGMIPPSGAGNIRLTAYRTGVGAAGDTPAGSVTQMKTTLPSVSGVFNPTAAAGGAAAESLDNLKLRAPKSVRHGGRCVTRSDFEDLALETSTEVARTLCAPLRDLAADPDGVSVTAGVVSVIIAPLSAEARPTPSAELVDLVRASLAAAALPTVRIVVVGPEFVSVDLRIEIALARSDLAASVESAARTALLAFLHPLTGGAEGRGWAFGRSPHRSDLFRVLSGIPGVDHVRSLIVTQGVQRPGVVEAGRFLICPGQFRISFIAGAA